MSLIIDVISRKTSVKQTLINPGDVTVVIYEPSVVQVHAQALPLRVTSVKEMTC